jgi:site-specific recombinase XerD
MNEKLLASTPVAGPNSASHLRIIGDFLADLRGRGFASSTIATYRATVQACAAWMIAGHRKLPLLEEVLIERFLRQAPRLWSAAPDSVRRSRYILTALLSFLRQRELAKREGYQPLSAVERLIARYDRYLQQVCGLAEQTRRERRHDVREFLKPAFGHGRVRPRKLRPKHIRQFMARRTGEVGSSRLRSAACTLRSFLRFLHVNGLADERLIGAVACPASTPRNPLPQTLTEAQVRMFLRRGFDRLRPVGRRDFTMALCLCRLGLRAGELARLELQDVNWQNQTLRLRQTKSRRERVLPLPAEVAQAMAQYLSQARPTTTSQRLFARHRLAGAPSQGVHLVLSAMRRGFRRAGLGSLGVHQLRHTFATRMHCRGVDLKRIADLLGHKILDTTARYARVDFEQLRQASRPWPKG